MRFSKEIRQLIKISNITNFPIGLSEIKTIIESSGWEIYSYKDADEIIDSYNLHTMAESNDSFAAHIGNRTVIFYDDNISQLDFPHILAHEIGHIVLGHLDNTDDIYAKERDCECFADELLNYVPFQISILLSWIGALFALVVVGAVLYVTKSESKNPIVAPESSPAQTSTGHTTSVSAHSDNASHESDYINTVVYITEYGTKYHIDGCRYIKGKDNLLEVTIEQAEKAGYEPCEICFEDILNSN